MAGPVYRYKGQGFPEYYENVLFIYEWSRFWIREVHLDSKGEILHINDFLPNEDFLRPVDMVFDKQGNLYILEYGQSWYGYEDSKISKITYKE